MIKLKHEKQQKGLKMKKQTINLRMDNRHEALKQIRKTHKGFVTAKVYTKDHLNDFTIRNFDYLLSYCLGYYNFFVTITTDGE